MFPIHYAFIGHHIGCFARVSHPYIRAAQMSKYQLKLYYYAQYNDHISSLFSVILVFGVKR